MKTAIKTFFLEIYQSISSISLDFAFMKDLQWEAIVGAITLMYMIKSSQKERKKLREQEEKELYRDYKRDLIAQLDKIKEKHQRHLSVNYKDFKTLTEIFGSAEEANYNRNQVFNLFDLMSDIEFMYCKNMQNGSLYWKRFDHIFKYVFKKTYFVTAFFKFKERHAVNTSFIDYVEDILKAKNKDED